MLAVCWDRPGSRYHNVVHFVYTDLVEEVPGHPGRVIVMWPKKGNEGVEKWEGNKVEETKQHCKYQRIATTTLTMYVVSLGISPTNIPHQN